MIPIISNIKLSVKLKNVCVAKVLKLCNEKHIPVKSFANFIVVRHTHVYTIFRKHTNGHTHINATKIRSRNLFSSVAAYLGEILDCLVNPAHFVVDTITATVHFGKEICLQSFLLEKRDFFKSVKYNNEVFPGIFARVLNTTIIIFSNGKLVCVGAKSETMMNNSFNELIKYL
jgi:TATA-box binding protein (TBP) (component of TFIID and TFIIIB)